MFAFCQLLIFLQLGAAVSEDSPKSCSGGYRHGARVDRGRYWFECQDGQIVPKGCLTDDSRSLNLWETYDRADGVRMQCIVDRDGYLTFSYKACVNNGREYQVNYEWQDQKNYYTCKRDRDFVQLEVTGCIDSSGRRVAVNEKSVKDDFVYQCKKQMDQSFAIVRVGCYENGRQYEVGDDYDKSNGLWYTCTTASNDPGAHVVSKCIGCVRDGRHYKDGEHYVSDDIMYGCKVEGENTKWTPVGCVTKVDGVTLEKRLDCSWAEGAEPYQYEVTCRKNENANTAVKERVRCVYKVPQGTWTMDPGCYRVASNTAVGCLRNSNGQLEIRALRLDDVSNGSASSLGLRYC